MEKVADRYMSRTEMSGKLTRMEVAMVLEATAIALEQMTGVYDQTMQLVLNRNVMGI